MVSDVLVVGGGLAGAAAALDLARGGVAVHLLERARTAHHKVCGEFVSGEVIRDLERLGVDLPALGAVPIDRVRLVARGRMAEAPLPFAATGVSRAVLDDALLDMAQAAGATIERGVRVTGIDDPGSVATSDGPRHARRLFLATGKHVVRGVPRGRPGDGNGLIGVKMHWRLPPAGRRDLGSAVELVLFDGGYVGFQRVADATMNMSLLVSGDRFGSGWEDLLGALMRIDHVRRRLDGAEPLFPKPMTIANLPFGYVCAAAPPAPDSLFRLGDQAALTAPLTGDGMAIAVRSARVAVACYRSGLDPAAYHSRLRRMVAPQVRRAMMLQRLAAMPAVIRLGMGVIDRWPGLLGTLAAGTRIPERRRDARSSAPICAAPG